MASQHVGISGLYSSALVSEDGQCALFPVFVSVLFVPSFRLFVGGRKCFAFSNSSYLYLASVFGNGSQVSERKKNCFPSIHGLIFTSVFYLPTTLHCTESI